MNNMKKKIIFTSLSVIGMMVIGLGILTIIDLVLTATGL